MIVRGLFVPNTPTLLDVTPRPDGFPAHSLTISALASIGSNWQALDLDAIAVISPHFFSHDVIPFTGAATIPQIYDLDGFPETFYAIRYPAIGAEDLAHELQAQADDQRIPLKSVQGWGLDHGAWAPLSRMFATPPCPILAIGHGWKVTLDTHQKAGNLLAEAARHLRLGVIATGSLYHRLDRWTGHEQPVPKLADHAFHILLNLLLKGEFTAALQLDSHLTKELAPEGDLKMLAILIGALTNVICEIHDWAEESEFGAVSLSTLEFIPKLQLQV